MLPKQCCQSSVANSFKSKSARSLKNKSVKPKVSAEGLEMIREFLSEITPSMKSQ